MTLEEQIKALLEAKKDQDQDKSTDKDQDQDKEQQQPESNDDQQEPHVAIANPISPGLQQGDVGQKQEEQEPEEQEQGDQPQQQPQPGSDSYITPEAEIAAAEMQGKIQQTNESISDLLGDEFTEEFKSKAEVIFQAAVKDQVMKIAEALQQEYKTKESDLEEKFSQDLDLKIKALEEETSEKIDGYLNVMVQEWKQDNEIALEAAIKSELVESFINSLKTTFAEHYIELPDSKVDVYAKVVEEKATTESKLSEAVEQIQQLKTELTKMKREQIIEESSKDFSSLDVARFKRLVEDFEFDDESEFKSKLNIVKNSFFNKSTSSTQIAEEFTNNIIVEDVQPLAETTTVINQTMSAYVRALSKK